MIRDRVGLSFGGARRIARLRELTGRDEHAVGGTNTANAIALLDRLLDDANEGDRLPAADLVAADRDRLLAAVYARAFGDRIESTLTCTQCAQPFDLHFSLRRLIESIDQRVVESDSLLPGIRIPTGRDELAAADLSPSEAESFLRARAMESGEWPDAAAVGEALERIAPLLDLELVARCAECGYVHTIQFDIQSYVLGAILAERRRLLTEVNRVAYAYSWSLEEILSLTRTDRRTFVELIENERVAS
jgi:hypothetical protein